jgi:hypothetical protein
MPTASSGCETTRAPPRKRTGSVTIKVATLSSGSSSILGVGDPCCEEEGCDLEVISRPSGSYRVAGWKVREEHISDGVKDGICGEFESGI